MTSPAPNPLADASETERDDLALVRHAQAGSRDALELLVERHQRWIYNIVLRMLYHPEDAKDATQELLIRMVTKLSSFQRQSSFRTWLYRLVVNHVLNMKRGGAEARVWTFSAYARELEETPDTDLWAGRAPAPDERLLVEEARISCTSGMLLCLDRRQRLVYILGEIFGVSDGVGSELLETTRENFRQLLTRARRDLHSFMQQKCGLVDPANPCRCAVKTRGFIKAGYVDPEHLLFATSHVTRMRDVARTACGHIEALDEAYGAIHRNHPFHTGPDFVAGIRRLLGGSDFGALMEPSGN